MGSRVTFTGLAAVLLATTTALAAARGCQGECATAAASADTLAEETLRQAIDAHFGYYQLPFGSMPDYPGTMPFSRAVNALIDQTEMGAIDYDPFCQCQDYDENAFFYAIRSVKVTGDRGEAVVSVKAVASAEPGVITLKLLREDGKWVVDDVIDAGGSLRDYLRE